MSVEGCISDTCTLPIENEQLRSVLAALVALGPRGHRYRPIAPDDVAVVEAANRSEPTSHRSTKCWECVGPHHDQTLGYGTDRTWADWDHDAFEVYMRAKALADA